MSTSDFIKKQLEDSRYQVEKVFEGLTEAQFDEHSVPEAMSPRQLAIHLTECYIAFIESTEGIDHKWGSYTPTVTDSHSLMKALFEKRDECVPLVLADPEKNGEHASSFIILHDAYHVGQLATLRLKLGGWEPYSIYKMG